MVYPVTGAVVDRVGFLTTFKAVAALAFGASLIVLLTRKKIHLITRHE